MSNTEHSPPLREDRRRDLIAMLLLVLIVLVGLAFRLYRLREESIDLEEYACVAHLDAPDIASFVMRQKDHYPYGAPLAPLLEYLWAGVVGNTIVRVRLFFVLAGILTIVLLYHAAYVFYGGGRRGRTAGLIAALCMALSHVHIFHAQEARMYALVTLFALLSVYTLVRAAREHRRRWWILNAAANVCIVWTHFFAVFLVIAEALFLLSLGRGQMRRTLRWGFAHLVLMAPLAAWILSIPQQAEKLYSYYHQPPFMHVVWDLIADDVVYASPLGLQPSPQAWGFLPPAAAGRIVALHTGFDTALVATALLSLLWVAWRMCRRPRFRGGAERGANGLPAPPGPSSQEMLLLLLWFALPTLLLAALSYLWQPCFSNRYSAHSTLALYLILGGAFAALPNRGLVGVAAVLLALLYSYQLSLALPGPTRSGWRPAAAQIASTGLPDEPVLLEDPFWLPVFEMNFEERRHGVVAGFERQTLCEAAAFYLEACARRNAPGRVWALLVDIQHQGGGAFEACLRGRGLRSEVTDFRGQRHLLLYHIARDAQAGPPGPEPREFLPSLPAIAGAIGGHREHDSVISFRKRIAVLPDSFGGVHARLGLALAERGQGALACASFRRAIADYPAYAVYLLDIQQALLGHAEYEPVLAAVLAALTPGPDTGWALFDLLSTASVHDDPRRFLAVALKAAELEPEDVLVQKRLAEAREANGDLAGAIVAYRKAMALDPDDIGIEASLGVALAQHGDLADAVAPLRGALARDPTQDFLRHYLVTALVETRDLEGAIAELEACRRRGIEVSDDLMRKIQRMRKRR